jgi:hypothetical protein
LNPADAGAACVDVAQILGMALEILQESQKNYALVYRVEERLSQPLKLLKQKLEPRGNIMGCCPVIDNAKRTVIDNTNLTGRSTTTPTGL